MSQVLPGRQEEWRKPSRSSTRCKVCSQSFLQCSCKTCSHLQEERSVEKKIPPWHHGHYLFSWHSSQWGGDNAVTCEALSGGNGLWGHKSKFVLAASIFLVSSWRTRGQDPRHMPVSADIFVVAWRSEMTTFHSWFSGVTSPSYFQLRSSHSLHCRRLLK